MTVWKRAYGLPLLALLVSASVMPRAAQAQTDMSSFYADPAKYMLYGCKQLAEARPLLLYRMQKLEALMARAASGDGGVMATNMAYRNDYLATKGDLNNLDARAADRRCPAMPQTAVTPPGERPLDGTVAPSANKKQR